MHFIPFLAPLKLAHSPGDSSKGKGVSLNSSVRNKIAKDNQVDNINKAET